MKKRILGVLIIFTTLLLTFTLKANTNLDYVGVDYRYGDLSEEVLHEGLFEAGNTEPVTVDETKGVKSVNRTGSTPAQVTVDNKIEIIRDSLINQNVLSFKTKTVDGASNAITETKTGRLANVRTEADGTGNSTAISMDINFQTNQVSWMQFFARDGGLISGSNINVLSKVMHVRWISGPGTKMYFGNADGANVDNYDSENETFKVWEDFVFGQYYNITFLFKDNGIKGEDTLEWYVDGVKMFEKTITALDFNQNVEDLSFTQQGSNTATNEINIANLSASRFNPVDSISTTSNTKEVDEASTFEFNPTLNGLDTNYDPTFSQYDVIISDSSLLTYDKLTNKFTAEGVTKNEVVEVTFTSKNNPSISKTVEFTIKPVVGHIPVSDIVLKDLFKDNIKLHINETFNLNNLFNVLPSNATDKDLLFELDNDNLKVDDGVVKGLKAGTTVITVKSNDNPAITNSVTIEVLESTYNPLFNFDINTEYTESNDKLEIDGFRARGSGGKEFDKIVMENNELFGVVPIIYGKGASNAGAATLVTTFEFQEFNIMPGKDYKMSGYVFIEGTSLGGHRVDIKFFNVQQTEDGYANYSTNSAYTTTTPLQHNTSVGKWVYFETDRINAELDASGLQLELVSWNNNDGIKVKFANVSLVEMNDVVNHGFDVKYDEKDLADMLVELNQELQLVASFVPQSSTTPLTFTSSDETVATVTTLGLVEAVGYGVTIITITDGDSTKIFELTVANPATAIELSKDNVILKPGVSDELNLTVTPVDHTDELELVISNNSVANAALVAGKLTITGLTVGETTVTVKVKGTNLEAIVNVEVLDVEVTDILTKVGNDNIGDTVGLILKLGSADISLTTTVLPVNRLDKTVTYKSNDEAIVKVSSKGVVEIVGVGETTITLTAGNFTKTITVIVSEEVENTLTVTTKNLELNINEEKTINAIANETITYESKDSTIATVDSNGKVKGLKEGTVKIIVKSGSLVEEVTVIVKAEVKKTSNTALIFIVSSVVVLGAVGSGAFIFFRKRK